MNWIGSPNFTKGRQGNTVDRIVVHWMAGTLAATDSVFQNTQRGTSAHFGIENDTIHKYVDEADTAYHSGQWPVNLRSVGIEHSAAPDRAATDATYRNSAALVAQLCQRFGIPCDRAHIIKHSEVVPTACPGTIDLDRIIREAGKILNGGGDMPDEALKLANHSNKLQAIQWFIFRITMVYHNDKDVLAHHFDATKSEFTADERNKLADRFFASQEYADQGYLLYELAFGKATTDQQKQGYREKVAAKSKARVPIADLAMELMGELSKSPQSDAEKKIEQIKAKLGELNEILK